MNRNLACVSVTFIFLMLVGFPFLQNADGLSPNQKDLNVEMLVQIEKASTGFNYKYTLTSSPESKQTVDVITLLDKGEQGVILTPQSWRYGDYTQGVRPTRVVVWLPGDLGSPGDNSDAPPFGSIGPGQTSELFGLLEVSGPPIIIEWRVEGWTSTPAFDEETENVTHDGVVYTQDQLNDTDFVNNLIQNKIFTNDEDNFVRGNTLGPSIPPTDIVVLCDTFIVDLIGQVREAAALGWIKHDLRKDRGDDDDHGKRKGDDKGKKKGHEKDDDEGDDNGDDDDLGDADKRLPGVAKSIIKKLTKVRRECLRGKFGSAREKVRALIKQVNAQRGKHLTEEAYALIRFNAEFLLEKL